MRSLWQKKDCTTIWQDKNIGSSRIFAAASVLYVKKYLKNMPQWYIIKYARIKREEQSDYRVGFCA